jgi:hypothetical protein
MALWVHVAVNSQRAIHSGLVWQFSFRIHSKCCDAVLEVLNNDVIFAGNRRTKTNVGSKPDLLMHAKFVRQAQIRPSSPLRAPFASAPCEHQNQLCLAGPKP